MSDQSKSAFNIIPADSDFVNRIGELIPLETADREALTTIIAGHRMMHCNASPSAETNRQLQFEVMRGRNLCRIIHNLVSQIGGSATVKDADIPYNFELTLDPVKESNALVITAGLAPLSEMPSNE